MRQSVNTTFTWCHLGQDWDKKTAGAWGPPTLVGHKPPGPHPSNFPKPVQSWALRPVHRWTSVLTDTWSTPKWSEEDVCIKECIKYTVIININGINYDLIFVLQLIAGRGRQMDAYVDDLFDPVLDQGPPVSNVISFILFCKLYRTVFVCP